MKLDIVRRPRRESKRWLDRAATSPYNAAHDGLFPPAGSRGGPLSGWLRRRPPVGRGRAVGAPGGGGGGFACARVRAPGRARPVRRRGADPAGSRVPSRGRGGRLRAVRPDRTRAVDRAGPAGGPGAARVLVSRGNQGAVGHVGGETPFAPVPAGGPRP